MENLAIVILNYNNYKDTLKCVNNLIKIGVKQKILIVDNKSNNDSYKILKEEYSDIENIEVIESKKNGGYSYGNNYGIKYILKKDALKYICIMNPDVIISYKEIFDNIIKKLELNNNIAAMSAIMVLNGYFNYEGMCWDLPDNKTIYKNHIMFLKNKPRKKGIRIEKDYIAKVDVIPGSFFIIKREELEKIGFLDENLFLYNEENMLSKKLLLMKKTVALSVNDYYEHNHKDSSKEKVTLSRLLYNNKISFQSRKYLCEQFYPKSSLFKLKIVNVINIMYIFIYALVKGKI